MPKTSDDYHFPQFHVTYQHKPQEYTDSLPPWSFDRWTFEDDELDTSTKQSIPHSHRSIERSSCYRVHPTILIIVTIILLAIVLILGLGISMDLYALMAIQSRRIQKLTNFTRLYFPL